MLLCQWISHLFDCVACLTVSVTAFAETIRNMFGCGCYIVVECYGRCLVWLKVLYWIDHVWSSKECVCVVPVIPVCG